VAHLLIVYDTKNGQTQKIAAFLGHEFKSLGHSVDIFRSRNGAEFLDPEDYEGVIIGGPVYAGSFRRSLRNWVHANWQDVRIFAFNFEKIQYHKEISL
jgi:menaquinone-dependent protoporphyrinogen IX oxidase